MGEKPKLVSGTVILSVAFSGDKSILDAHHILQKTRAHLTLLRKENRVVLKGKNLNPDQIVSDLKKAGISARVEKILEDPKPKPKVTVHLKVEDLCCQENANKLKSKLGGIKGIEEVLVDVKLKKVTLKGSLESKEAVEAASKVVAVKIWEEPKADKDKDKGGKDKDKEKQQQAIVATAGSQAANQIQQFKAPDGGQVFVYTTKDLHFNYH